MLLSKLGWTTCDVDFPWHFLPKLLWVYFFHSSVVVEPANFPEFWGQPSFDFNSVSFPLSQLSRNPALLFFAPRSDRSSPPPGRAFSGHCQPHFPSSAFACIILSPPSSKWEETKECFLFSFKFLLTDLSSLDPHVVLARPVLPLLRAPVALFCFQNEEKLFLLFPAPASALTFPFQLNFFVRHWVFSSHAFLLL